MIAVAMIYLYLSERTIKVLSVAKSVIGQQSLSHFHKIYESDILGESANADIIGTAIKEALSNTAPAPITDNEVCLILPQEKFQFMRFPIPTDIAPSAVASFLKDKLKSENHIHLEDSYHDFIIAGSTDSSVAMAYIINKSTLKPVEDASKLINLKIQSILADTICYYTLFSKTLREDKIENILYATYEPENSSVYEYDSLGLINPQKIVLNGDPAVELSNIVKKYETNDKKVHRIILSGSMSKQVRQDHFTKEVGAWTNPLERIILNFYHSYLKSLSIESIEGFSLLHYDMCFGAHIFSAENKSFSLLKNSNFSQNHAISSHQTISNNQKIFSPKSGGGNRIINFHINFKFISILVASLLITMGIVLTVSKGGNLLTLLPTKATPTPEPTAIPTATATPTPVINRDKLKIKVLNGGGVKGKATEVKDFLKEKGYGDIITGNANSFDIEKSKIEYRPEGKNLGSLFKSDLVSLIEVAETSEMESSTSADIIFTIGKDLK